MAGELFFVTHHMCRVLEECPVLFLGPHPLLFPVFCLFCAFRNAVMPLFLGIEDHAKEHSMEPFYWSSYTTVDSFLSFHFK